MKELPKSAKDKIEKSGQININVGSGTDCKPNVINYDIRPTVPEVDIVDDIFNLKDYFGENTVDNILCFQVLEHFRRDEWRKVLEIMCSVVKPGGRVHIRLPDIPAIVDENRRGRISDFDMYRTIYGQQDIILKDKPVLDYHKCGVSLKQFKDEFEKNDFVVEEANHVFGIGMLHIVALKNASN